ncbi:MAG TPA: DUF2231 domain-containing protein [Thermoanaerobaculia bacterium]|nr:DUF2231 domain-containing protein [Thermoanaerobaculia bacterium]
MSKALPIRLIEKQPWLAELGETLQPVVQDLLDNLGDEVRDLLHGKWLGHPLHPVLTDIPVGAWTAALVLDGVELMSGNEGSGNAADLAIGVGLAGAVGAAVTGAADWSQTEGKARTIGVTHALLNVAATTLYATSLVMRRSGSRRAGVGVSLLGFAIASASAYLGGHLVFGESVGVEGTDSGDWTERYLPRE